MKVLVIDDDPLAGSLSRDILAEKGFDAELLNDSLKAIDQIRSRGYDVVVLDILMPGLDGLTLCHKIKSDPQLRKIKVVMVSGKSFESERRRAKELGADLFIAKPYDVETFSQSIQEVAKRGVAEAAATTAGALPVKAPLAESLSSPSPVMNFQIWGCRGPAASGVARPASRYGTKTACASLEIDGRQLIFDAGSGLLDLGRKLVADKKSRELWLLLTHFHRDHIEGLGDFPCARSSDFTIHLCGSGEPPRPFEAMVREALETTMTQAGAIEANFELHELIEQSYELMPGIRLTAFYANHPGMAFGFMIEAKGKKIVYCPDSEIYGEGATAMQDFDEKLAGIVKGADFLVLDARYDSSDYQSLRNNGHSSVTSAVDLAARAEVKRLLLFHQDAQYDDTRLDLLAVEAEKRAAQKSSILKVAPARDGVSIGI